MRVPRKEALRGVSGPRRFSGFWGRRILRALALELKINFLAYRPLLRQQPVWILVCNG
jgi:hypothetical protein